MSETRFTDKALASLEKVVEAFRTGTVAAQCALATYPMPNIPAAQWTLCNRWLALMQTGEVDCRGYRQWQEVGRHVVTGAHAAFILRPKLAKEKDEQSGEEVERCVGFAPLAVFPIRMTEGDPLTHEFLELPPLPLANVFQAWGIEVIPQPFTAKHYGLWAPYERTIILCAPETSVLLHELCHAAHSRLAGPKSDSQQEWLRETVAELGAEVLRRILGSEKDTSGNAYAYIEHYAKKQGKSVLDACLAVLRETAKVIGLILETAEAQPA